MDTAFKVGYSLVVAILLVLAVILGQRTFYDEPDYPGFQPGFSEPTKSIYCNPSDDDACYINGVLATPEVEAGLSESDRSFLRQQREVAQRQRDYENDREDYFRNVFIIATVTGLLAIGAGLFLFFRRIEAMPLGLLLGGIGVVIYGWVESARGPDEALGTGPLFAVAAVGLVAVLAAGYWFLGRRESSEKRRD